MSEYLSWLAAVVAFVSACVLGKGCNDSDNQLVRDAISRGCLVDYDKGGHRQYTGCKADAPR